MGFLLLGNLSVNDQGTGRFLITKAREAPKGNPESPWSLSYGHLLKNPFHKSSRSTRASCQVGRLGLGNDGAKVSKSSILVNARMAEYVPFQNPAQKVTW
jgi:hypothetical protein